MSLTSYRAAPPRDKPLRAFENRTRNESGPRPRAPINPVRRLPEKSTRANALRCERYVPTQSGFGKARDRSFGDFMTARTCQIDAPDRYPDRSCQKACKSPALEHKKQGGDQWRIRLILWWSAAVPAVARSPAGFPRTPERQWRCWRPAAPTTIGW